MKNRSLLNNDYLDNFESSFEDFSVEDFSIEDNLLDDIRFNHDLTMENSYNEDDYVVYVHARAEELAAYRRQRQSMPIGEFDF